MAVVGGVLTLLNHVTHNRMFRCYEGNISEPLLEELQQVSEVNESSCIPDSKNVLVKNVVCLMDRDGNWYDFIDTNTIIDSAYQPNSLLITLLIPDFLCGKKGLHRFWASTKNVIICVWTHCKNRVEKGMHATVAWSKWFYSENGLFGWTPKFPQYHWTALQRWWANSLSASPLAVIGNSWQSAFH